jgi:acetyl esterase
MAETQALDPLMEMLKQNPPKDALEFRATLDAFALAGNGVLPEIGGSEDDVTLFSVGGTDVTADIHLPKGSGPFPVLLYLHGGGWIMGSPKTHRRLAFRFAEAGYLVVNVHYRLAPEFPFPAAFDDCVAAIRWVKDNIESYGGDPSRLAVGGDSAGGNLAAAAAAALAGDPRVDIKAILLIYAALDFANMNPAGADLPGGANLVEMMVGSYLGNDRESLVKDWRVSPIHAAERLPRAHILCGTADGLMADTNALVSRLAAAGIPHELATYDKMPHGFAQMEEMFPEARVSIDRMIAFLEANL